jgi:hypothetical protein
MFVLLTERNGVRNFNDSNIENKMKSFNIFWEVLSLKKRTHLFNQLISQEITRD